MSIAIKVGLISIDSDVGIKTLCASVGKDNYQTFQHPVGTNYQVPAEKIFKVGIVKYSGDAVKVKISFGYGDDVVTDSATPPTNAVIGIQELPVEIAGRVYESEIYCVIPSGKYPFMQAVGDVGQSMVIGIEE